MTFNSTFAIVASAKKGLEFGWFDADFSNFRHKSNGLSAS
jgi:hypothetical protein